MLKVGDVFKFKTVSLGRKFYNKEFEVVTISHVEIEIDIVTRNVQD